MSTIRNFVIIAHIDHGKSTLADRFLEYTGTIEKRKMHEQFLDMHPLEREKGITIKMQPVRMNYKFQMPNAEKRDLAFSIQNSEFILNLIDTPGHVDFTYEVSRALAAVEGAILLVDATQGVQAQTLANLHLAQKEGLVIIPVINKIDLPSAEVEKAELELIELLGVDSPDILKISAKTGIGIDELLEVVAQKVPPPEVSQSSRLRALIFDSHYDAYQGVIAHVRVFSGSIKKNEKIRFVATGQNIELLDVGIFSPEQVSKPELGSGQIGYIATGIKEPERVRVGDTIIRQSEAREAGGLALPGYREPTPMVFASVYPENQDEYEVLRESLKKLKLNDASLSFEPEESSALGRGYRTGFLGMLHMEIVAERLRREYNLSLIFSNPSVVFKVKKRSDEEMMIYSASRLPQPQDIESMFELWAQVEVITPPRFLGALTTLINEREGTIRETINLAGDRLVVKFEAPLREIIIDFYDRLKSISQGFASMSYALGDFRKADLIKLDILVAGEKVNAFSEIVPREKALWIGRERIQKLKDLLPRELFAIALQAEVEGRVIARETIAALKKDVTGYLYGGDRTRKMKLWKKQQRGKKRLKEAGKVDIPADVFLKMLKK